MVAAIDNSKTFCKSQAVSDHLDNRFRYFNRLDRSSTAAAILVLVEAIQQIYETQLSETRQDKANDSAPAGG